MRLPCMDLCELDGGDMLPLVIMHRWSAGLELLPGSIGRRPQALYPRKADAGMDRGPRLLWQPPVEGFRGTSDVGLFLTDPHKEAVTMTLRLSCQIQ